MITTRCLALALQPRCRGGILAAKGNVIVLSGQTGALWCALPTCTAPQRVQPLAIPGGTGCDDHPRPELVRPVTEL